MIDKLKDPSPLVRLEAVSALAKEGLSKEDGLLELLANDNAPAYTKACAIKVLGEIKSVKAEGAIIEALSNPDVVIRCPAAIALGKLKSVAAFPHLVNALGDESRFVRTFASTSLIGIIRSCDSAEKLLGLKAYLNIDHKTGSKKGMLSKICLELSLTSDKLLSSQVSELLPSPHPPQREQPKYRVTRCV